MRLLARALAVRPFAVASTFALALALLAACAQRGHVAVAPAEAHGATTARPALPSHVAAEPAHLPGLHNVVAYAPGLVAGGQPEGEEGLRTLADLGFATVVSVDGAAPDVTTAESLGLRYVHVPISYDAVPDEQARRLASVLHSLPGPYYVHCHHGKHRSAGALGTAAVVAGRMTAAEVEQRMEVSGASKDYAGLWASVREAKPADPASLRAEPASFPKVAKVSGMVATMAAIDVAFDHGKTLNQNGWKTPATHPDLVPAAETKQLLALLAQIRGEPESEQYPAEFHELLARSVAAAESLDAAVRAGDAARAKTAFAAVNQSCKECHAPYRDR